MKKIGYLLIVVLTCFLITGCSSDGDDKMLSGKINAEINIKNYGVIKLELDADSAPITVTNFVNPVFIWNLIKSFPAYCCLSSFYI